MPSVFAFQGPARFINKRKYIFSNNSTVYYLLGSVAREDSFLLAKENGWEPVDLSIGQSWTKEQILVEYLELIAVFNQWNAGSIHWWATHFSSKNRINSPVLPNLNELHHGLSAMENLQSDESLVLLNYSWPVVMALQVIASQGGHKFVVYSPLFSKFKDLAKAKYLYWKSFFAEVVFSYLSIRNAKRAFGKSHTISPKSSVYLIRSFAYLRSFEENIFNDPFFGKLPSFLNENKEAIVLTIALGFQDRVECYQKMKKLNKNLVHPIEIYITYWDVLKRTFEWLWQLIFHPFKIKGRCYWLGNDITPLFQELKHFGGFRISFSQSLEFDIAKRLGEKYQIQECLMTYEGRPWERFFIAGLRKANLKTKIIGCQHTVIPLSAADMFLHPKEKNLIPLPDKILTTGMITKKILERYGSFPKEQIEVGCALRFESLQNLSLLKRRKDSNHNFVLLVAFGGSQEEVPLLNYALEQAFFNKDIIFHMRTHPVFSWKQLMSLSSWRKKLPDNVENSIYDDVLEDLKNCDAVLYWGTTVALESLMVGKPVIQFDRGDLLNYDPLFEFTDFKWQVQAKDSLQIVIKEIQALPDTLYCEHQQQGKKYMKEYFYPVTKENLKNYL